MSIVSSKRRTDSLKWYQLNWVIKVRVAKCYRVGQVNRILVLIFQLLQQATYK